MARSQSPYLLFSLQSVPKTEIDTGVPHRHTVKSILKENKETFHKEASGAFFRFLKDHEVAVLVAHNGKRYVRSFLRFALVGVVLVSYFACIYNRTTAFWRSTDSNRLLEQEPQIA